MIYYNFEEVLIPLKEQRKNNESIIQYIVFIRSTVVTVICHFTQIERAAVLTTTNCLLEITNPIGHTFHGKFAPLPCMTMSQARTLYFCFMVDYQLRIPSMTS